MADCEKNILEIPLNNSLPGSNDVVIFTAPDGTSVIRKWSVILGAITPADIEFQIGATPVVVDGVTIPGDGDTVYTNTALIGKRVRVFRQFLKQTTLTIAGSYKYNFNSVTGEVIPSPAFAIDEVWSIEIY